MPERTDQLDGLRLLAFLAVFFFHFSAPAEYVYLVAVQKRGWVGVEVFFALSSYLLFSLMQRETDRTGTINLGKFYARRLLRIYPLMICFSIAMLILYGEFGQAAYAWVLSLASFVGNYVYWFPEKAAVPHTGHLWSLSYEFQVYLVLPLLFLARQAAGNRAFVASLLIIVVICLIGRSAFTLSGMSFQMAYMTPILRPESVVAGIFLALGVTRNVPLTVMVGVFIASSALMLAIPNIHAPLGSVVIYPVAGVFAGSLLHVVLYSDVLASALRNPVMAYLGRISFGLYVFHLVAFSLGMRLLRQTSIPENYATRIGAGLTVCIALAAISYHLFEMPINRRKPRADSRNDSTATLSAVASQPT
ncbi:acyltransferase [Aminobacter aminovorans]|uniref:acyltransferase family protein n=1 Tax=Aminobacter aminovorans TaxID=83263 RepID=UPI0028675869|nr:acyltransferase [Aminobacter aminovorans]MDR7220368.1 peptidoglycan/LPS O-acetylase OafA/YrhL [Aminobacter aminovorans]